MTSDSHTMPSRAGVGIAALGKTDLEQLNKSIDGLEQAGASEAAWNRILDADFSYRGSDRTVRDRAGFIGYIAKQRGKLVLSDSVTIEIDGAGFATARCRVSRATGPDIQLFDELRIFLRSGADWKMSNWFVEKLTFGLIPSRAAPSKAAAANATPPAKLKPAVTFPSTAAFKGGYTPQAGKILVGLQSTYNGAAVVTMVDRKAVEAVLPVGLQLADPVTQGSAYHPVLHLIGDQDQPSTFGTDVFGGDHVYQVGGGYREMLMLIPFTVRTGDDKWHNFAVRMFLDNDIAVEGGNTIYGYAKLLAQLTRTTSASGTETAWQITAALTAAPKCFFRCTITKLGSPIPESQAASSLPRWPDIKAILSMPIIGTEVVDHDQPGSFICSYWELDFTDAQLQGVTSVHQIVNPFRQGMNWPKGEMTSAPDGAVQLSNVRWRLQMPPPPCAYF